MRWETVRRLTKGFFAGFLMGIAVTLLIVTLLTLGVLLNVLPPIDLTVGVTVLRMQHHPGEISTEIRAGTLAFLPALAWGCTSLLLAARRTTAAD